MAGLTSCLRQMHGAGDITRSIKDTEMRWAEIIFRKTRSQGACLFPTGSLLIWSTTYGGQATRSVLSWQIENRRRSGLKAVCLIFAFIPTALRATVDLPRLPLLLYLREEGNSFDISRKRAIPNATMLNLVERKSNATIPIRYLLYSFPFGLHHFIWRSECKQ